MTDLKEDSKKVVKNYKSLGQMMKVGDFQSLLKDLVEMKEKEELKSLKRTNGQTPISEFDDLLFFFPQYAHKTIEVDGKKQITKELHEGAIDFLKFALENGANPNAYMKNGENTYLKSCQLPSDEVLNYLVINPYMKVDLTHTDGRGNNGLFYAVMSEATEVINYLVNTCNFDVNEKNFLSNNQTVLHYACGHIKDKSFNKLIELSANPSLKDGNGYQPYELIFAAYDPESIEKFDINDPDDLIELDKSKELYDKAKSLTETYVSKNKVKFKTKF